ncbi:MAG: hypothetical protein ACOC0P_00390 [Planctomycetota bacterium]
MVGLVAFFGWRSIEPGLRDYLSDRHQLLTATTDPVVQFESVTPPNAFPSVITESGLVRGRHLPVANIEASLIEEARTLAWGTGPFDHEAVEAIHEIVANSGWLEPESVSVTRDLVAVLRMPGEASDPVGSSDDSGGRDETNGGNGNITPEGANQNSQHISAHGVRSVGGTQMRVVNASQQPGAGPSGSDAQAATDNPDNPAVDESDQTDDDNSGIEYHDQIVIRGAWRQPFALIRWNKRDHLVDANGILLPMTYAVGSVDELPVLVGVEQPAPARAGRKWKGQQVDDGLGLLRYLAELPGGERYWLRDIAEVDVSNVDGRRSLLPRLAIVGRGGYTIHWGRPVGKEQGIEQPAAAKVGMLDRSLRGRPKINDPAILLRVNHPLSTIERRPVSPEEIVGGAEDGV